MWSRKERGLKRDAQEDLMGMRGNPVCPIVLNDCRVPRENLLGDEGQGMRIALSTLEGGRIGIGSQALGIAQACLEASIKYAQERYQFGKRIADFGAIQGFLADMATRIEAARLLIFRASSLRDRKMPHSRESAMAKLFASETAVDAARIGLQIHGGYGYSKAYPIERYYRDAKVCEIYEGDFGGAAVIADSPRSLAVNGAGPYREPCTEFVCGELRTVNDERFL